MRCPDCNRFVSYDEPQAESNNDESIKFDKETHEGTIAGSVRVMLPCGECGTELKESTIDYGVTFNHECSPGKLEEIKQPGYKRGELDEWEVEFEDAMGSSRMQTMDRHGKPIKSARYMKTFYGADITLIATCPECGEKVNVETSVEEQASSFEELV